MEAVSDEACLPAMRDLCLQLLANVSRVQVAKITLPIPLSMGFAHDAGWHCLQPSTFGMWSACHSGFVLSWAGANTIETEENIISHRASSRAGNTDQPVRVFRV